MEEYAVLGEACVDDVGSNGINHPVIKLINRQVSTGAPRARNHGSNRHKLYRTATSRAGQSHESRPGHKTTTMPRISTMCWALARYRRKQHTFEKVQLIYLYRLLGFDYCPYYFDYWLPDLKYPNRFKEVLLD